jgi:hypothetical protein
MASPADAFARLLEVLDRMEISYEVVGSVASSAHGIPRTSLDIDLVVDIRPEQIEEFAAALQGEFYADAGHLRESFGRGRAANLIHLATAMKFDLFPHGTDEYSRTEFSRRGLREVRPDGIHVMECSVISPEDLVLRKLEWYRAGGEMSERQWNDLRGVCRTGGRQLDVVYLRSWSERLKLDDLLERLLAENGL